MKAKVTFHECIQDLQEYGTNDEHMVSRVFLTLEVEGRAPAELEADVKQTVGASFGNDPLEVSMPKGYKGPLNFAAFRECTERYYRSLVGAAGSSIRIGSGASNIRMRNNIHHREMTCSFDVDLGTPGW